MIGVEDAISMQNPGGHSAIEPAKISLWSRLLDWNSADSDRLPMQAVHGYIPGLDGLRAIAVLIVIIAHFGLGHLVPGGFGVTVFFFISGFLITRLLLAERDRSGDIKLKNFYIRRAVRLYPALLFMVFGTTLIYGMMRYGGPALWEFLSSVFYFGNIFQVATAGDTVPPFMPWKPLWSLAVEEHFYLFFPLMILILHKLGINLKKGIVALLILVPLWRLTTYSILPVPAETYNYVMTDARIDSIAWGCLLAVILHQAPDLKRFRFFLGFLPVALALILLLETFLYRGDMFRYVIRYSIQGAALFILVLNLYYLKGMKPAFFFLENPVAKWIGLNSYAIYLWHYPIYDLVHRNMEKSVTALLVTILLTAGISAFSMRYVEKPFIGLRKRFGSLPVKGR